MVVAGAADRLPERVAHLVYLDSDAPRDGDTSAPPGAIATREFLADRWTAAIRLTGAGAAVPTTYVRCAIGHDPAEEDARRQDERVKSERSWHDRVLAARHNAPFTAPRMLADLLHEIAST